MLPGMAGMAGFSIDTTFTVEYLSTAEIENTSQVTHTFSSQGFGSADTTREIYVLISWSADDPTRTISSATIGGIAATIRTQDSVGDGVAQSLGVGIISAAVPTGTTGTIAITFSAAVLSVAIGIVRVLNKTTNVAAAASCITDGSPPYDRSVNINVNNQGAVLACWVHSTAGFTTTWTNVTERYDSDVPGGSSVSMTYSGAMSSGLSASTPLTITATSSGGSGTEGVGVAAVSIA